jgi:site-specific DNA-methyltransferase (adenine-specific)
MLVELKPISSIRPYDNNPRLNDAAIEAVAASIREFGFRQPLHGAGHSGTVVGRR